MASRIFSPKHLLFLGCSFSLLFFGCKTRDMYESSESSAETQAAFVPSGSVFDRVEDPATLMKLETMGFHFGGLIPGTKGLAVNNRELKDKSKAYSDILAVIAREISVKQSKDPILQTRDKGNHHVFDQRMLVSPEATFELTGVFNRVDMALQFPGLCAGVRFLYRLAYKHDHKGREDSSRVPMTVALNYRVLDSDTNCSQYLKRWVGKQTPEQLMSLNGPLSGNFIRPDRFQSVELNYQVQTWPSSMAPKFGAFGEYVFRVFSVDGATFSASEKPLFNSIDATKIKGNTALKEELKTFIKSNSRKVARGTATIPEKFLAKSISSFTPGGLNRLSNRPFSQIFSAQDFSDLDFKSFNSVVNGPNEFVLRLNDMTCSGCHSGRSVNGFHHLGEERPKATHRYNTLFIGSSEAARNEKPLRIDILNKRIAGMPLDSFEVPLSIEPPPGGARMGSTCAFPEFTGPGKEFEGWGCVAGLKCVQTDEPKSETRLGKCFNLAKGMSGNPCNLGNTIESANPLEESLKVDSSRPSCGGGVTSCSNKEGGFPSGMCRRPCGGLDSADESCGPIASDGFNSCLGNPSMTFVDCLSDKFTSSHGRARCDRNTPCRSDYFCSKIDGSETVGACVPSYFFFQLGNGTHPVLDMTNPTITLGMTKTPPTGSKITPSEKAKTGLILKKKPLNTSDLAPGESCVLPAGAGKVIGIGRKGAAVSGHIPVEVTAPSSSPGCENLSGLIFVFGDHAKFF